jgi:hypothetical protein
LRANVAKVSANHRIGNVSFLTQIQFMEKNQISILVPDEMLARKIYLIRGQKVMLDRDLAELYSVDTKRLKEQVRRNLDRFPEDFMFELTKEELEDWRSQNATSNSEVMGLRYAPFAFTEHGVLMLSSVLNSKRAIAVNIRIMRIYTSMKEMMLGNAEIMLKVERIEHELISQGRTIEEIFDHLAAFQQHDDEPREPIGFRLPS